MEEVLRQDWEDGSSTTAENNGDAEKPTITTTVTEPLPGELLEGVSTLVTENEIYY
jgi:hypothetical protein